MKENLLDVLMYLFENCLDGETGVLPEEEDLRKHLDEAGFQHGNIEKAFDWLEGLTLDQQQPINNQYSQTAMRIFSQQECAKLDCDSRSFIIFLEQNGILDPVSRELVIDRAMALETDEIDLPQLKWVALMVLFNQPDQDASLSWMEELMFNDISEHMH